MSKIVIGRNNPQMRAIEPTASSNVLVIKRDGKLAQENHPEDGAVMLLIDRSGSMATSDKMAQARSGALDFAENAYAKGYAIGLISFDDYAEFYFAPQKDIFCLRSTLAILSPRGGTSTKEAMSLATKELSASKGYRVIVFVTDGKTSDKLETLKLAVQAKFQGIEIIAIGTDDADSEFLQELASKPDFSSKVRAKDLGQTMGKSADHLPMLRHRERE